MNRVSTVSVVMVITLLWSDFTECQLSMDHQKVAPRLMIESGDSSGAPFGLWGSWGTWGECSRSCGGGVQQHSRQCLSTYSSPTTPFSPRQGPSTRHQDSSLVISAVRPSVPFYRNNGHFTGAQESHHSDHGEQRKHLSGVRPGKRRGNGGRISPGMYGYGKMPYVVSSQRDQGKAIHDQRQSRSPSDYQHLNYRLYQQQIRNPQPSRPQNVQHRTSQQSAWAPLLHTNSGVQFQGDHHSSGSHGAGAGQVSPQARHLNPLPVSSCSGAASQYRMCNTSPCPQASKHIRDIQCSTYNNHPFMGRLYEWESFNEVPVDQLCQLHCRAIGYRFYVRHSDQVIDGTPCRQNETKICVAGKCQSLGCDELLGSGKVLDKCGVCGGDNTACKLISGLFQHSLSKVGYHKIVEIPEGATKINITEMVKSQNYLALRSRSGRSIINGNWAIDRPGKYEGGGTMFTYQRPNEIRSKTGESFLAEGPTNEILEVYMIYQQPNPGVHYEYIIPLQNSIISDSNAQEGNTLTDETEYNQYGSRPSKEGLERTNGQTNPLYVIENQVPPRRHREYNWKLMGKTDCTVSCGKGSRYSLYGCVHRVTQEGVSDSLCDTATKPSTQEEVCNIQPCPAFWDIGEWSECSKTCGLGMQHRQILCRQFYANRTLTVPAKHCEHLERPESSSTCQLKICSEWQIRSDWSLCSMPCGVGQRTREVHCISNLGDIVEDTECNMKLRPSDVENCDMGPCAKSWFYTDWAEQCSAECGFGVRSRSVVCLSNMVSNVPLDACGSERPSQAQACNSGPCESRTEWFTGSWSQCSTECGVGSQQRVVVCMMKSDDGYVTMPTYECSSLDKPLSQQSCKIKECGAKWYYTDWSACSKTCEGGFRVRVARCLSDEMTPAEECEERLKPIEKDECNPEPCVPQINENCRDKYFNCNVVVQARLCVYDYYKKVCCASCARGPQRHSPHRSYR